MTTSEYLTELHSRINGALDGFLADTTVCACTKHVTDVVMEILRQERHNMFREGVTYATTTIQEAITCTRGRYEAGDAWPDPATVLLQTRRTVRRLKHRYEGGTSLDDPKLEALALTTSQAQPDNPTTTPPTEGTPE